MNKKDFIALSDKDKKYYLSGLIINIDNNFNSYIFHKLLSKFDNKQLHSFRTLKELDNSYILYGESFDYIDFYKNINSFENKLHFMRYTENNAIYVFKGNEKNFDISFLDNKDFYNTRLLYVIKEKDFEKLFKNFKKEKYLKNTIELLKILLPEESAGLFKIYFDFWKNIRNSAAHNDNSNNGDLFFKNLINVNNSISNIINIFYNNIEKYKISNYFDKLLTLDSLSSFCNITKHVMEMVNFDFMDAKTMNMVEKYIKLGIVKDNRGKELFITKLTNKI